MELMRRTWTPWLLALPLMVGGSVAAHAAAYRLALPEAHDRARGLQLTGHSYLEHLPLLLALVSAPALVALSVAVFSSTPGRARPIGAWPFALLPPLSFVLQEHLERFMHSGAFPWETGLERAFMLGLLLQVPFSVIAFVLMRALLAGAHALRRVVLRRRPPRAHGRMHPPRFGRRQMFLPRIAALALGHAERGPPPIRV